MQVEWREDMLDADKRSALQDRTDQFLGKPSTSTAANTFCDSSVGIATTLPPKVLEPVIRPAGEAPRFDASESNLLPAGGTVLVPYCRDNGPATTVAFSNTAMSADMTRMVTSGMTSHADPVALAQGSGDEQRLILDMAPAISSAGPGGFTGIALAELLRSILYWTAPPTSVPEFSFRWSPLAAKTNLEILQRYDMDLGKALEAQPFSTLTIGSEFRPTPVLEPLLQHHPLWPRMKSWLNHGIVYPLHELPEVARQEDLHAILARGNHKSATLNADRLQHMLQEEVVRGWQLVLPREAATMIPHAVIGPVGLVEQDSINDLGEIVPKWRMTHDQSFNVTPNTQRSINDRLQTEHLTPCRYGRALMRHIHGIVNLRRRHPTTRILQTKIDWKSAYRRAHYHPRTAVQSIIAFGSFLLMALRMTFGGAANPSQWSDISEVATDLSNDLVRDEGWDANEFLSPHQQLIGDSIQYVSDEIPFAPAAELAVQLPDDDHPKADCYIDDMFSHFLEQDAIKGSRIIPFVLHLLSRPIDAGESLMRDDVLSISKFLAEATPAEREIILGWILDTR